MAAGKKPKADPADPKALAKKMDWTQVKAFVEECYRLIGPKVKKAPRATKTPRRR